MSTSGIGAKIAAMVNRRRFKVPPNINYYRAILYWLAKYKAPSLRISDSSGLIYEGEAFLTAIGNGNYAGNGLGLCPQAKIWDPEMALTIIGNVTVLDFLRYQGKLARCVPIPDPRVSYSTRSEVSIEVLKGALMIEGDGESMMELTVGQSCSYKLLEDAISII